VNAGGAPQHSRPLWLASLVTPFVALIAWFVVVAALDVARSGPGSEVAFRMFGAIVMLGLPPAYGAMFLVGLPLLLLMRSQRMLTGPNVCLLATIVAVLTLITFFALIAEGWPEVELLGWSVVIGLLAGVTFCLVAGISLRWRSP
jgi:hypothetical protein